MRKTPQKPAGPPDPSQPEPAETKVESHEDESKEEPGVKSPSKVPAGIPKLDLTKVGPQTGATPTSRWGPSLTTSFRGTAVYKAPIITSSRFERQTQIDTERAEAKKTAREQKKTEERILLTSRRKEEREEVEKQLKLNLLQLEELEEMATSRMSSSAGSLNIHALAGFIYELRLDCEKAKKRLDEPDDPLERREKLTVRMWPAVSNNESLPEPAEPEYVPLTARLWPDQKYT